jgi:hypothetical protein
MSLRITVSMVIVLSVSFFIVMLSVIRPRPKTLLRGALYLMGENLKVVRAEFSTLS